jgi:serine/threonine-protein kinase
MTALEQQATMADPNLHVPRRASEVSAAPLRVRVNAPAHALLGTTSEAATLRNTTVLPQVEEDGEDVQLLPRSQARYQRLRRLGAGAMGEVNLVTDNDIGRTVAVKQLLAPTQNPAGIARFIDEIRTVGRLEHPNIVPIHDVGVDEQGQIFFVMKHIDGETLESILEKLAAGDPQYVQRYTLDVRIEIFMGILRALQCAHEKGVIHRDIKPANVMIGRFGEVVLMDWGVAKLMPQATESRAAHRATQQGSLIGTPAYMSPEQASGDVDAVDARSDLYSATVLFHELLGVQHYLQHAKTLPQLLQAILSEEFRYMRLVFIRHPRHPVPPAELLHYCVRGLAKDPAARYQSAAEMIAELSRIREGRCRVSCPATLAKRMLDTGGRFVQHYPKLSPFIFYAVLLLWLGCLAVTARALMQQLSS